MLQFLEIISNITRFKILFLLKENKSLHIKNLAKILEISQSGISHQVTILSRAGLLKKIRQGQYIVCSLLLNRLISNLFSNLQALEKVSSNKN